MYTTLKRKGEIDYRGLETKFVTDAGSSLYGMLIPKSMEIIRSYKADDKLPPLIIRER